MFLSNNNNYYYYYTEHLREARNNAFHPKSQELIDAQITRNRLAIESNSRLKQLRLKEEQLEQQRKRQLLNGENSYNVNGHNVTSDNVKYEIVRAMEQQDSLLEILIQKQPSAPFATTNSAPVSPKTSFTFNNKSATKIPVCDKTTIEELRLSNQQLKLLVEKLLNELEGQKGQNVMLRKEIASLKKELASDRDTKSLTTYLDDSMDTPKLLY